MSAARRVCKTCDGKGKLPVEGSFPKTCPTCEGDGYHRRRGERTKHARYFRLEDVDLGNGERVPVMLKIDGDGFEVRRVGSWRRFSLPLLEGVELLARRAQVRTVQTHQGRSEGEA